MVVKIQNQNYIKLHDFEFDFQNHIWSDPSPITDKLIHIYNLHKCTIQLTFEKFSTIIIFFTAKVSFSVLWVVIIVEMQQFAAILQDWLATGKGEMMG